MNYKYPPICKYGLLLILIFLFIKHQHIMIDEKILFNSISIVLIFIAIDYIIIKNHEPILGVSDNDPNKNKHTLEPFSISDDDVDVDSILDDELDKLDQKINKYIEKEKQSSDDKKSKHINNTKSTYDDDLYYDQRERHIEHNEFDNYAPW